MEGTSDPNDGKSTGTAIGTGKANTAKLVEAMGDVAYYEHFGIKTTSDYAAKLCADCNIGGYSDWFLPSKDELNLMYENLRAKDDIGEFYDDDYWSSTETDHRVCDAWFHSFDDGNHRTYSDDRSCHCRVRPVRAF